MKIVLSDGRPDLYQWDSNRYIESDASYIEWIVGDELRKVVSKDGRIEIDNELLQTSGTISGYAVETDDDGNATHTKVALRVIAREKPADYIYTPTEVQTVQSLIDASVLVETTRAKAAEATKQDTISDLEEIRSGAAAGATAVQTETDPTVPSYVKAITEEQIESWDEGGNAPVKSVNSKTGEVVLDAADVGALPTGYHDATKQDTVEDLSTIRSGAAAGATALQAVPDTYRTSADQDEIDDQIMSDLSSEVERAKKAEEEINTTLQNKVNASEVNELKDELTLYAMHVDTDGHLYINNTEEE